MNIQTKFKVGDTLFTLDKKECRVKPFEVGSIHVFAYGEGEMRVLYKAKGSSAFDDAYDEDKCFATKDELLYYLTRA